METHQEKLDLKEKFDKLKEEEKDIDDNIKIKEDNYLEKVGDYKGILSNFDENQIHFLQKENEKYFFNIFFNKYIY